MKFENSKTLLHDINEIHKRDWFLSHSISTTPFLFTSTDRIKTLYVTTGAGGIAVTLPPAAESTDRIIEVIKIDSGVGTIALDGSGAETIQGQASIDIEKQYCGLRVKCDGTAWYILDCIGRCKVADVSGTLEMIYYVYELGTTAAGAADTYIAYETGTSREKILHVDTHIQVGAAADYYCNETYEIGIAADRYVVRIMVGFIRLTCQGAFRNNRYRVYYEYYI
jgi:hypothetical protein